MEVTFVLFVVAITIITGRINFPTSCQGNGQLLSQDEDLGFSQTLNMVVFKYRR